MKVAKAVVVGLAVVVALVWFGFGWGRNESSALVIREPQSAPKDIRHDAGAISERRAGALVATGVVVNVESAGTPRRRASLASWAVLDSRPRVRPAAGVVLDFTKDDLEDLLIRYAARTNLLDRQALTVVMAFVGGDEVQQAFEQTLLKDAVGRHFSARARDNEEDVLCDTVLAMGLVAQTSDRAYDFIRSGTDPAVWRGRVKWTSGRGSDSIAILTSMSIQAVGKSDRSDSRALLEELRSKPVTQDPRSLGFNRNLAGAVVSGLFSCDMLDQEGLVGARALFADPERSWKRYLEWAESESGKRLTRWCDEVSIRPRAAPDGDYK